MDAGDAREMGRSVAAAARLERQDSDKGEVMGTAAFSLRPSKSPP